MRIDDRKKSSTFVFVISVNTKIMKEKIMEDAHKEVKDMNQLELKAY
jgi:hypothetical protein